MDDDEQLSTRAPTTTQAASYRGAIMQETYYCPDADTVDRFGFSRDEDGTIDTARLTETVSMDLVNIAIRSPGLWCDNGPDVVTLETLREANEARKPSTNQSIEYLHRLTESGGTAVIGYAGQNTATPRGGEVKRGDLSSLMADRRLRRVAAGPAAQNIVRRLRSFLFRDGCIDIDIVNCHPSIALAEAKRRCGTVDCTQHLQWYCDNRDALIAQYGDDIKTVVLKAMYTAHKGWAPPTHPDDEAITRMLRGVQETARALAATEREFVDLLMSLENKALSTMTAVACRHDVSIVALCYDGMIIRRCNGGDEDCGENDALIAAINTAIYPIRVAVKPWMALPSVAEIDSVAAPARGFDWDAAPSAYKDLCGSLGRKFNSRSELIGMVISNAVFCLRMLPNGTLVRRLEDYGEFVLDKPPHRCLVWRLVTGQRFGIESILCGATGVFVVGKISNWLEPGDPRLSAHSFSTLARPVALRRMTPAAENIAAPIIDHIRNAWCGGDVRMETFVLGWMGRVLRRIQTRCILVITGPSGTGKSIIASWFANEVLGKHLAVTVVGLDRITGRFNGITSGKSLVVLEEVTADPGARAALNILKDLVTNENTTVERKGLETKPEFSALSLIAISNHPTPIPAVRGLDRRLVCLTCPSSPDRDAAYFRRLMTVTTKPDVAAAFARSLLERVPFGAPIELPPIGAVSPDALFDAQLAVWQRAVYFCFARAAISNADQHPPSSIHVTAVELERMCQTMPGAKLDARGNPIGPTVVKIGLELKRAGFMQERQTIMGHKVRCYTIEADKFGLDLRLVSVAIERLRVSEDNDDEQKTGLSQTPW